MRSSRPAARAALAFPPTQVAPQEKRERPASGGGGGAGFASRLRRGAAPGRTLGREGGTGRGPEAAAAGGFQLEERGR